jgi:hypothetical protein
MGATSKWTFFDTPFFQPSKLPAFRVSKKESGYRDQLHPKGISASTRVWKRGPGGGLVPERLRGPGTVSARRAPIADPNRVAATDADRDATGAGGIAIANAHLTLPN